MVSGVSCKVFSVVFFKSLCFFSEKLEPSMLNDPRTILLYFGALRPPGKLQK